MSLKQFLCFLLIFVVNCEKKFKGKSEIASISGAFREVVEEFYIKNQIRFEVIIIRDVFENFDYFYDQMLSSIADQNAYMLFSFEQQLDLKFRVEFSVIIFMSSCNDFIAIHSTIKLVNRYQKDFKFLIYIQNCELIYLEQELINLIKIHELTYKIGTLEVFEFLLINDGDFLHLMSIEWFTRAACNLPHLKILNSFNKIIQKWTNKLKNYEKFQNFYGCNLTMGIYKENLYHVNLAPEIFNAMSNKFNFNPIFIQLRKADVGINVFLPIGHHFYHEQFRVHFISAFTQSRYIILTNSGNLLTFSEKLLLAFDDLTWILVLFTFFVAFIAIFIINRLPEFIQNRIHGFNIRISSINIISTFFGSGHYRMHHPTFTTIFLVTFSIFCLIIRNCYQSKLLELLITEPKDQMLSSIEDLNDHHYSLYSYLTENDVLESIDKNKHIW